MGKNAMNDLKRLLAEGDPLAREPEMSDVDIQAMRRTILSEARLQQAPAALWGLQPLALAVALVVCLSVGVSIGLRLGDDGFRKTAAATPASRANGPAVHIPRQLQITSPGGTRIIWTFHQELDL
jgi:hypothetical protein